MKRINRTFRMSVFLGSTFIISVNLTSCSRDNPFDLKWTEANPDTASIYSLSRPELNLPSGFDLVERTVVKIEDPNATGNWDFLLDSRNGELVFVPPAVFGIESEAKMMRLPGLNFDEVLEAPSDTSFYSSDEVVPVETGSVYVVQTHRGKNKFGMLCVFYGKLQPLESRLANGTVTFIFDRNELCGELNLVPKD
ncbi:MAG: hypothetical protein OSA24_01530 [Longimicrobiales bacterium]|nr:hypothetical protein [Longimicrobiales bacterium]